MGLDRLDRLPNVIDGRTDGDAEMEVHQSPRKNAAACSGAIELA